MLSNVGPEAYLDLFEFLSGVLSEFTGYLWWILPKDFQELALRGLKFSLFSLVDFRLKTVKDIERFSVLPGEMSRVELENY